MKILIIYSGTQGHASPFIEEQIDSLTKLGIESSLFPINKKGLFGYLSHLAAFHRTLKQLKPDLIHAHYGLSGLFANLQRSIPVITTFHGSDINDARVLPYSKLAHKLSAASIFVEESMMQKVGKHEKVHIIPCGVDTTIFQAVPKSEASQILGLNSNNINILFSSSFDNPVKNYRLAKESCNLAEKMLEKKINLIELKGYKRDEVNMLLNAVDCALLTSFNEGSPQFIKEAMACNCPIVSTDVGDVREVIGQTEGCYITSFESEDVAAKIRQALAFGKRTNGREKIGHLDNQLIAAQIIEVYRQAIAAKKRK